jgi:hypothetical protein
MNSSFSMCEEFRVLVENYFAFLQEYGFQRSPHHEYASPTSCTVVYLGRNVGFLISYDIRDSYVSVQVARVNNGTLKRNWDGGYSADLWRHFVDHEGYRGRVSSQKSLWSQTEKPSMALMIENWADFLISVGGKLLEDKPSSLPTKSTISGLN